MFLNYVFMAVLIHSVSCSFLSFIHKCPLSDPNADDCVLKNARIAVPHIITGYPSLNLLSYVPYKYMGDVLNIGNNVEIVLNGQVQLSPDTDLIITRINMVKKYWEIKIGGSSVKTDLNFTMNIYDNYDLLKAKGQITICRDNWAGHFIGHYESQKINDQYYMQVPNMHYTLTYDTFKPNYFGITTLDNKPLKSCDLAKVNAAFDKFKNGIHKIDVSIGKIGIGNALNAILRLEPENQIFI